MRHRSATLTIAASFALLALVALASTAVAGGWAQVTAQNVPADPPAGQETTISLQMLQHGVTPVSWPRLTVVATEKATGKVVRTEAVATGPEGSYVAKITFPTEGQWTLSFESKDLVMEGSALVSIGSPAAAPANPTTATPAAQAARGFDILLYLAVLAIFVVLGGGVLLLRRGTAAGSRVSAGT